MSFDSSDQQVDSDVIFEDGLLILIQPTVDNICGKTDVVRRSQECLKTQIDDIFQKLEQVATVQLMPTDIELYTRKLANSKKRVLLLASIVAAIHVRLNRIQRQINIELVKRRNILETNPTLSTQ